MTKDNLYYYPQTSYTKEEAIQIIKKFVSRKLERVILPKLTKILEICVILVCIAMVLALIKGEQVARQADEVLESCKQYQTSPYAESMSVEEIIWYYINGLEIPKEDVITESTEVLEEVVTDVESYYVPTEEERQFAYRLAFGEAGIESELGQILVINVAINNMRAKGYSDLIEEFTMESRYSSVINGEVYNCGRIVTVEDVPQSIKDAVDAAFECDYSEKMLKEEANKLGITDSKYWEGGSLYFYNPDACSDYQNEIRKNVKVKFRCGRHLFYRYWDK